MNKNYLIGYNALYIMYEDCMNFGKIEIEMIGVITKVYSNDVVRIIVDEHTSVLAPIKNIKFVIDLSSIEL